VSKGFSVFLNVTDFFPQFKTWIHSNGKGQLCLDMQEKSSINHLISKTIVDVARKKLKIFSSFLLTIIKVSKTVNTDN
jgi:hypothetical protein